MGDDTIANIFIVITGIFFGLFGFFLGNDITTDSAKDAICKQTCITTDCYFKCKEQKFADVINGLCCTKEEEEE